MFIRFCGFSASGQKPDTSTLCRYRHRLTRFGRWDKLLALINRSLEEKGLEVKSDGHAIGDALIVSSARRPRQRYETEETASGDYEVSGVSYSSDEEASWTKKGDTYYYDYRHYVASDALGLVIAGIVEPAGENEVRPAVSLAEKAVLPTGTRYYTDQGGDSRSNRAALKELGLKDGIMKRAARGQPLSDWQIFRNSLLARHRSAIERILGTLKRTYDWRRSRYIGLGKVRAEGVLKSIAYNLKRGLTLYKHRQVV